MAKIDEEFGLDNIETTPARAFAASELVACPACSRTNAPTRAKCLYCGLALPTTSAVMSPERGFTAEPVSSNVPAAAATEAESLFHVVARLREQDRTIAENPSVARLSQLTRQELSVLLSGKLAPLATATSATQAQAISNQLNKTGITTTTIPEEDLKLQTPPKEIGTLALGDSSLTAVDRRTGAKMDTPWEDVTLVVIGRLFFTTTEVEQTRRRKQVVEERQLTTDEAVFDIYHRGDATGWRIRAGNFDFSCLGNDKKPTAFENFRAVVDSLRKKAGNALFDEDYLRIRAALTKVWPLARDRYIVGPAPHSNSRDADYRDGDRQRTSVHAVFTAAFLLSLSGA